MTSEKINSWLTFGANLGVILGLLGENIPRSIRGGVRAVIGNHKLSIQVRDEQKYGFTGEYVVFVEETIAEARRVGQE